ncbi:MAG: hypothetical protein KF898_08225 [Parachlamydiales bacterium]|nr:hypothetical protein [Candidatus Acheromyda pituitae]
MKQCVYILPLLMSSLYAGGQWVEEDDYYDDVVYEAYEDDSIGYGNSYLAQNNATPQKDAQNTKRSSLFSHREPLEAKRVNFFVSYLFWKTLEDNLEYVIKGEEVPSSQVAPFVPADANGDFKFGTMGWSSGVRAGLGYTFNHDLWDVFGIYTYYSTDGTHETKRPKKAGLNLETTFRDNSGIFAPNGKAHSHASLVYMEGDLLLGRRFLISDDILLKLLMGMLGTNFDQHWRIRYSGTVNGVKSTNHIQNNWEYSAGGARLGVNLDWYMGWGLSLIGQFSGALTLGYYDFFYKAFNKTTNPNPTGVAHFKETRIVPTAQAMLGLEWGKFYNSWGFYFSAGYEVNSWFGLHLLPVTPYSPGGFDTERFPFHRDGNVSFHGLNLTAGFSF